MYRKCLLTAILVFPAIGGMAQTTGGIKGVVTLEDTNLPLHNVVLLISQLKMQTVTDEQGNYEIKDIPPGNYTLIARLDRMPDVVQRIEVTAGPATIINFQVKLTGLRDQVTVSATGSEQSAAESFQSTNTLDAISLTQKDTSSLGEALESEAGVAKRGQGPGASRPVIRGFDGDRVLITQDGMRTGSLSYASGDHGEPINLLSVERVEVVRGPATLLYGSSAIGGMVNAVTGHEYSHKGLHGFLTGIGSTTNNSGGASGGLEFGTDKWLFWGNGGGQRSGDYNTSIGTVLNSGTKTIDFASGAGYYLDSGFISLSYSLNRNRYGVPANSFQPDPADLSDLNMRRHNVRLNGGLRNVNGPVESLNFTLDYSDYKHEEIVKDTIETSFFNKTLSYRAVAEQQKRGNLSGSFGISGFYRDFKTVGEEVLAPPTKQNSFAAFALETIDTGRLAFQFGGRVEQNSYVPDVADLPSRSFTGFSGSAGIRTSLWEGGTFSANYTHSYRAPSLDELYNNGPHPGNLTFEIGNPNLTRERGEGIDISLRQSSNRFRGEAHYFYYRLSDFVFLAPRGTIESGLPVSDYLQSNSRFTGAEVDLDIGLRNDLWFRGGMDYVNARLTDSGIPLIRIPPMRGRIGFDYQKGGFRVSPELIMTDRQDLVFTNETQTAGYATLNLMGSYTISQQHAVHIFAINAFNLNDKLYRNHLSFIKEFAPEIGRGVRFTYTVKFF